jgi:hypothetical protein
MILFKALLIAGVVLVALLYLARGRSPWRDRFVVVVLMSGLVVAVLVPDVTSVVAQHLGVGRGVDLAFYVGFLLLFFLVAMQRARIREQDRTITTIVREIALLRAERAGDAAPPPGD